MVATLSSGLPEQVADDEDLARFIVKSGDYSALGVKPSAFLPNPRDRETSVSRHGGDPLTALWALGAGAARDRQLYGAAIVRTSAIRQANLQVIADEPPDRHATIRGWPWVDDDLDLQKARQKELALVLASVASLLLLKK